MEGVEFIYIPTKFIKTLTIEYIKEYKTRNLTGIFHIYTLQLRQ